MAFYLFFIGNVVALNDSIFSITGCSLFWGSKPGLCLSMSIVTVQLGQCGNQIGFEVFDALFSDSHCPQGLCSKRENEAYQASCKERFFSEEENGGMCGPQTSPLLWHNQPLQGQALHVVSEPHPLPSYYGMILLSALCFCVNVCLSSDIFASARERAQIMPI